MAVGGVILTTGTAHADASTATWDYLTNTGHGVGVYSKPWTGNGSTQTPKPLFWRAGNPDAVQIDCWTAGGDVGSYGDVWYRTWAVYYATTNSEPTYNVAWTFAPFVDSAGLFHNGVLPQCP